MPLRYKALLVIAVTVGIALLSWGVFVWAPRLSAGDVSSAITRLNEMEKLGLPSATVSDGRMAKHNFRDLSDKVKQSGLWIVHFWASWCGPCVEEFPALIEFAKSHPTSHIFAIAEDEEIQNAVRFHAKFGKLPSNFEIYFDPDLSAAQKFGTEKLPESYLFCPTGKLLQKLGSAGNWAQMDFQSYLRACEHESGLAK